jgi:hypothetical protein
VEIFYVRWIIEINQDGHAFARLGIEHGAQQAG